jgi:hypothetical protein
MEVEKASVIFPRSEELASFCVVGARAKAEMFLEVVQAAHATKKGVFGGPASDAANGEKFFEGSRIAEFVEGFKVQFARGDGPAQFEDGAFFILAVTKSA